MTAPLAAAPASIAVLLQGPFHRDTQGYSTVALLDALNASVYRARLHVVSVVWDDDTDAVVSAARDRVDEVVIARRPATHGAGNRNLQSTAVRAGLDALAGRGFTHVLKSRHDFLLSERILSEVVTRADAGFTRVFATNLFTRREAFHVSDMLLFSTYENVRAWYDPGAVYYQDLYAAEVQFARCFVRNKGLPYPCTQAAYLRFLRDWIELIDWKESGVVWFKAPRVNRAIVNRDRSIVRDRDSGIVMSQLLAADYPDRLRRRRGDIQLHTRATLQLVADALYSYLVVVSERLLRYRFRIRARFLTVPIGRSRVLHVKLGVDPPHYNVYPVDAYGAEEEKPIGRELEVDPRTVTPEPSRTASPDPNAAFRGLRGPVRFALRPRLPEGAADS